jgi:hypothetical protein
MTARRFARRDRLEKQEAEIETEIFGYAEYESRMRELVAQVSRTEPGPLRTALAGPHLDGQASKELRRLVPLAQRRSMGAFFTNSSMRQVVGDSAARHGSPPYFDPACGAGDLLLAVSNSLDLGSSPVATMAAWSQILIGADLEQAFTAVARHRLRLAAFARHAEQHPPRERLRAVTEATGRAFARVRAGDGIKRLRSLAPVAGTIVLNPPFGTVPAPDSWRWSSGLVPRAALFVEAAVQAMTPGSTLVAILPDVLRSGARLDEWRRCLLSRMSVTETRLLGQFDVHTDVDVFLFVARRTSTQTTASATGHRWIPPRGVGDSVGARFAIRTGPVVDNRDPHSGPWRLYVTARPLPRRGNIDRIEQSRRFNGTVFQPPFVLVRRTSRPSRPGTERITGVAVSGDRPIAVDNHLLVAIPRDQSFASCIALVDVLESQATTTWLNERIRCRHLTVGVLSDIPWSA